jgi:HTH-type transcriptional regulator, sugar sensing transcriptional regulator
MDNIIDYLKHLDLSDVEAKLYLTLLQAGPTSVRDLAQTIDIKRTTAYFYIDQLVDKGLIMKLVKGSKKLVAANTPDNLEHLVEEKLKKAKAVQHDYPEILKTLTASR